VRSGVLLNGQVSEISRDVLLEKGFAMREVALQELHQQCLISTCTNAVTSSVSSHSTQNTHNTRLHGPYGFISSVRLSTSATSGRSDLASALNSTNDLALLPCICMSRSSAPLPAVLACA